MSETVYLLTQSFLTGDGTGPQCSGLQRHIRELVRLLGDRGHACVVLQKALVDFDVRSADATRVVGLRARNNFLGDPVFNIRAHRMVPQGAPVIYCLVELTYPYLRERSVAVQHGVWWDGEYPAWKLAVIRALNRRALRKTRGVLCVDTNYINWCLDVLGMHETVYRNCHYVPNFVDPLQFSPPGPNRMAVAMGL